MTTIRLLRGDEVARHLAAAPPPARRGRDTVAYVEYDPAELAATFAALTQTWRDETGMLSVVQKKVLHPAYQRIIGLGPAVLPLLLHELERRPSHWFWALYAISGEDPVAGDATPEEARLAWLDWGRARGYLP